MNRTLSSRKNAARTERIQQRENAGTVETQFPHVENIVISMTYSQKGVKNGFLRRTLNFSPGSYALFKITCLTKDCTDGGFDLTQVITGMVKNRKMTVRGKLACASSSQPADHAVVDYEVAIQYQ